MFKFLRRTKSASDLNQKKNNLIDKSSLDLQTNALVEKSKDEELIRSLVQNGFLSEVDYPEYFPNNASSQKLSKKKTQK